MKPTFSWSIDIEKHRTVVALPMPACLQSPPEDTKAAALPEKKAEVAIAAPVNVLIMLLCIEREVIIPTITREYHT